MVKRVVFGLLLIGLMVGLFFLRTLSEYVFDGFILLVMALSVYELIKLFKANMTVSSVIIIAIFIVSIYPLYLFCGGLLTVLIAAVAFFVIMNIVAILDKKATIMTVENFMFMLFYPTLILTFAFEINRNADWLMLFVLTVGVASLTDTMALVFGMLIGGKKLCPSISPKKTVAGAVGGLIGGVAAGFICYAIVMNYIKITFAIPTIAVFAILGLIGSVMTQLGDLVASSLKRRYNIKDFGHLIPGHGGLLDRIDGILFNLLTIYLFMFIFM